jgi:hypothetical protein
MKQLSLLDLQPEKGPSPRIELDWHLFGKRRFEQERTSFRDMYGSDPIFWKVIKNKFDLLLTSPWQTLIIDRESGALKDPHGFEPHIWDPRPNHFSLQRREHLSPQILELLQGDLDPGDWQLEIMADIRYVPNKRASIFGLLTDQPVHFYVDMGPYHGTFRIFAPPETVKTIYMQGAAAHIFF